LLAYLLGRDNLLAAAPPAGPAGNDACSAAAVGVNPYAPKPPHFKPRATLGSVASSLPAYVVMTDARGGPLGGPNDWSAGFMPAAHQGTLFRSMGDPTVDLKPQAGMTSEDRRREWRPRACEGRASPAVRPPRGN